MEKHEKAGVYPVLVRLQRQVSYFGGADGLDGLVKFVGDDDMSCKVLRMMWEDRNDANIPYKPFRDWPDVKDEAFGDLVRGMTNLDPAKRITARQALAHPWFEGFDIEQ